VHQSNDRETPGNTRGGGECCNSYARDFYLSVPASATRLSLLPLSLEAWLNQIFHIGREIASVRAACATGVTLRGANVNNAKLIKAAGFSMLPSNLNPDRSQLVRTQQILTDLHQTPLHVYIVSWSFSPDRPTGGRIWVWWVMNSLCSREQWHKWWMSGVVEATHPDWAIM
jgi:hypothetical protein